MPDDPAPRLLERLLAQPKPVYASFNRAFDKSSLFQHFEVIRNGGLRRSELSAELASPYIASWVKNLLSP